MRAAAEQARSPATHNLNVDAFAYRNMLQSLRSVVASLANIRGRKALVFFSGGMSVSGDMFSDLAATIDACNRANVAVYTVGSGLVPAANSAMRPRQHRYPQWRPRAPRRADAGTEP